MPKASLLLYECDFLAVYQQLLGFSAYLFTIFLPKLQTILSMLKPVPLLALHFHIWTMLAIAGFGFAVKAKQKPSCR
ncbi:hypothetical protein [Parageobacillus thermoglucosidasius]|uniref:hypothetical protein n=1 Tax=Parageobacillus thermoglucosidasius TaxID=1426 RepID=UPI0030C677FB